jgi:hypothetical protein
MLASMTMHIPTQSANATDEWYAAWPYPGTWLIREIKFAPATAVAIDGTDYLTSTISTNDGAAGSFTSVASHNTNTGGTALVVGTTVAPSLTAGAACKLAEGYQVKIAKTLANAGKILDGSYTIMAEKVN